MLIILTLVATWVARNWWKLLLLLVGLIILHEYRLRKNGGDAGKNAGDEDAAEDPDAAADTAGAANEDAGAGPIAEDPDAAADTAGDANEDAGAGPADAANEDAGTDPAEMNL